METAKEKVNLFLRDEIKSRIKSCNEQQITMFKRMYSHKNIDLNIDKVIDNMGEKNLEQALDQIERTLQKKN